MPITSRGRMTAESLERRRHLSAAPITFGTPVVTAVTGASAPIAAVTAAGGASGVVVATGDSFGTTVEAGLQVLTADGDGTFTAGASFPSDAGTAGTVPFTAGNYTDGGAGSDVALIRDSTAFHGLVAYTLAAQASGHFGSAATNLLIYGGTGTAAAVTAAATADFAGDDRDDLALIVGQAGSTLDLRTYVASGFGVLSTIGDVPIGPFASATDPARQALLFADLYGDGGHDLIYFDGSTVHPFRWATGGSYTAEPTVAAAGDFVAVGRLAGGTGADDVVVVSAATGSVPAAAHVLRNAGGTLSDAGSVSLGQTVVTAAVLADLNDDGFPDLDVGSAALAGNGDGTFGPPTPHATLGSAAGLAAGQLVVADQTGDARPDLTGLTDGGVEVLPNTTGITARLPTTITLTSDPAAPRGDTFVTVTAALTTAPGASAPPSGDLHFAVNGLPLGNALIRDGATLIGQDLPIGTDTITATYGGDTTYAEAAATPLAVTVRPAAVTSAVTLSAYPNPVVAGSPITLLATVRPADSTFGVLTGSDPTPTGQVTFTTAGGQDLGTVDIAADGSAQVTTTDLPLGTAAVTATYGDDDTYTDGTSSAVYVAVTEPPVVLPPVVASTLPATATAGAAWAGRVGVLLPAPAVADARATLTTAVSLVPSGTTGPTTTAYVGHGRVRVARGSPVSAILPVRADLPPTLAGGTYDVQVSVSRSDLATTDTFAAGTVVVRPRTVDLSGTAFHGPLPSTVPGGGHVAAVLAVDDAGSVAAVGRLVVTFDAVPSRTAGSTGVALRTVRLRVAVPAGKTRLLRVSVPVRMADPDVPFYLSAAVVLTPDVAVSSGPTMTTAYSAETVTVSDR